MANLKAIRKRISSVKSTQKITRAQKMVAGARLTRASSAFRALRPFAQKTAQVLAGVAGQGGDAEAVVTDDQHPLLARREEKTRAALGDHQRSRAVRCVQHQHFACGFTPLARTRSGWSEREDHHHRP